MNQVVGMPCILISVLRLSVGSAEYTLQSSQTPFLLWQEHLVHPMPAVLLSLELEWEQGNFVSQLLGEVEDRVLSL